MSVTIRIPQTFRIHTGGDKTFEAQPGKLDEILGALCDEYRGLKGRIFDPSGEVHRFINIFVRGEQILPEEGLVTDVPDGSEVDIRPAIAGG